MDVRDQVNVLVEDVNLHFTPGSVVAIVGENGAGKTTLVKLLCGLYRPTSGRILVAGSLVPIAVRQGDKVNVIPAALSVFRVGDNGKLTFVRKYDIDTGNFSQWWSGMVSMA